MYELTLERFLHITHALKLYDGKYEPVHHHRWLVSATVTAPELDQIGAVMDFNQLATLLDGIIAELDGRNLNQHPDFADRNSSSEYVAYYMGSKLAASLPTGVRLDALSLYRDEALRARFTWRPDPAKNRT